MSSLGVQGHTESWEAHECDQQFGDNESVDVGKGQRLRKEDNARINKVSAMRPGLAKIIEKVHIARHFESTETNLHIAENACCIAYGDTWSSKRVHSQSISHDQYHGTTYYGCVDTLEFDIGVALASGSITRIHPRVARASKIHSLPATLHKAG